MRYFNKTFVTALFNAINAIDINKQFPGFVFYDGWCAFRFFQSDYIFSSDFVDIVKKLLLIEHSNVSCLVNLDRGEQALSDTASAIYINNDSDPAVYNSKLCGGGPADGWLYGVDRYVCSTELGRWCIYSEKANDIAVIGFRSHEDILEFDAPLNQISAKPLSDLIERGKTPVSPFNILTLEWKKRLTDNYAD